MDRTGKLGALLRSARLNAILAYSLVVAIAITAGGRLLAGDLFWAGFAATTTIVVLIPPPAFGRPTVMLPWEVVLLAAVPVVGGIAVPVQSIEQLTLHVSIAALALIISVELHVFTSVRLTDWFAVTFVVVTTLASEGIWSVLLWVSDELLRTQFIPRSADPHDSLYGSDISGHRRRDRLHTILPTDWLTLPTLLSRNSGTPGNRTVHHRSEAAA